MTHSVNRPLGCKMLTNEDGKIVFTRNKNFSLFFTDVEFIITQEHGSLLGTDSSCGKTCSLVPTVEPLKPNG